MQRADRTKNTTIFVLLRGKKLELTSQLTLPDMAFSYKYTRVSAIAQIILGALSMTFGIADRGTMYRRWAFHTESVVPIWMGAWIVITGIVGFAGSRRIPNCERPSVPLIGTYLGFSIVSIVFAGVIIIMYGLGIAFLGGGSCIYQRYHHRIRDCNTSVALAAMIIMFAIMEFGVGIWACICCCSGGLSCCQPQPQLMGQVIYIQTQHGPTAYVMTQGANGVPIAVPAEGPAIITPGQAPTQVQNQQAVYPTPSAPIGADASGQGKDLPPPYQPYTSVSGGKD